jgi:hypothetical protein
MPRWTMSSRPFSIPTPALDRSRVDGGIWTASGGRRTILTQRNLHFKFGYFQRLQARTGFALLKKAF